VKRGTGWVQEQPWDEPATGTSSTTWDLDGDPEVWTDPGSGERRTGGAGAALLLAAGLAGLGIGGLAGSSLAGDPAPRFAPAATIGVEEVHVDVVGAPGPIGQRVGNAMVTFRVEVDNPGPAPTRATALIVDGVSRRRVRVPLELRLPGYGRADVDLTLPTDCSTDRQPVDLQAHLVLAGGDGGGGSNQDGVPVVPSVPLERPGGLCTVVDNQSPPGWRTPIEARSARVEGEDLVVVLADLSRLQLDGLRVDGELLPTVFVGDQLRSTSAQVRAGRPTVLRLSGPAPCFTFGGPLPIPSTLRILAQNQGSLQQRLVVVGPQLSRWLQLGC
jgi:hypothetical protein